MDGEERPLWAGDIWVDLTEGQGRTVCSMSVAERRAGGGQ